jgi:hypothetical protein
LAVHQLPERAQAIIFVSALAGLAIVAPLWLTYISHCFLTVMTESSSGHPEVHWSDDSILDMWWKPLYCVGMLIVWLSAASLFMGPLFLLSPWVMAIGGGLFLWFAYPVGLLCVMDSNNSLALIHVPLLQRLGRHFPSVLLVGLMTLPLGAAVGGLLSAVMLYSTAWAVPAAVVLPPALFLYARCWGRLAWMLLNMKRRRQLEEAPLPEAAGVTVLDPWALPPKEPIPEMDVEVEEPEPAAPEPEDEWAANPAPYEVPAPGEAGVPPVFSHEEYYDNYRKREEERKARAEGRKPSEKRRRRRATMRNAFGPDFWPFLIAHRTIRAAANLGALTLGLLVLLRIALLMAIGM